MESVKDWRRTRSANIPITQSLLIQTCPGYQYHPMMTITNNATCCGRPCNFRTFKNMLTNRPNLVNPGGHLAAFFLALDVPLNAWSFFNFDRGLRSNFGGTFVLKWILPSAYCMLGYKKRQTFHSISSIDPEPSVNDSAFVFAMYIRDP